MTDVLIIGAGPTGLTLACALAQRGIALRIVDAAPSPPTGSRGKGLQPRSLELFDDLGIVDEVISRGVFGLPIRYHDDAGHWKDEHLYEPKAARPDAPYLASLILPQWRVEAALRHQLERLGVRVEFGAELAGLAQDESGVTAQFTDAASARVPWLVGCDGGKSAVRHLTHISFLGETLETHRMLVADVHAEPLDRDHWHIWKSAEGFLALCPMPSTDVFQFQASIALGQESDATLEVLQGLIERRTGHSGIRLSDPTWMSLWRANIRMVDRYRQGRIFLAGDAAHVHSPAGGQGMNTGIQDAYNLAWKLAAVLRGADAALLDTYQEERLPIAAGVLGLSNQIMAATVASGTIAFRRDERTLQLGLGYRQSSLTRDMRQPGEGLRAGDRAPDAPGLKRAAGECRMFDLLRGEHATLLGFGVQWQALIEECVSRFDGSLRGYVIAADDRHGQTVVDAAGHARAAYGNGSLFVIRPDNYVGMAVDEPSIAPVVDYLRAILPASARRR
jgi:2-polyprenyl-6-methoxyphenol hydroxylase-like FAD-dependent oxidoreductase